VPGDPIVSLEAMKTESVVPSPVAGTVVQILCDTGALVASGAPLVVVQTDG
jgi:urea carboxylase